MSVEEKDVEEKDIDLADLIYEAYENGETVAEEPENSEQPEVEAEVEDNQASVEAEPEPPIAENATTQEGQEQSALPEWTEGLNVEDDLTADAVEFFAGGEKAEWTRMNHKDMTPEQLQALKDAQSAYNKWQSAQKEEEDPVLAERREIEEKLWAKAKMMVEDKPVVEEKVEEPVTEDVMAKVRELMDNGETDQAIEALTVGLREENERKLSDMQSEIDKRIEEKLSSKLSEKKQNDYIADHNAYLAELAESDPRFAPALEVGSDLNLALRRIFEVGTDPITGQVIVDGKDPVEDLNRAYDYYRGASRGGQRVTRPAVSAQPPVGSVEGESPQVSKEDLRLDLGDYLRKVAPNELKALNNRR